MSTALVIVAALCWGLSGGIGGILMDEGWGAFLVSFYRGVIGLLFVLVWLAMQPAGHGLSNPRLWGWSVIAGLGVAGNFAFYFLSISQGSVAVAATLMYCAPVFVYLVSFALRLERPSLLKLAAIAVVMLVWPANTGQIVAAVNSADWPLFAGLGVLGAGLSFVLYVVGLREVAPAVASIVAMVEPVTASLFGVVVLHESLAGSQLIGMALILLAVTALSLYSSSDRLPSRWGVH